MWFAKLWGQQREVRERGMSGGHGRDHRTERTWRSPLSRGNLMHCLDQGGNRCRRTDKFFDFRILKKLRVFQWGIDVKNLGVLLWAAMKYLSIWELLGRTRKDLIRGCRRTENLFPLPFSYHMLCANDNCCILFTKFRWDNLPQKLGWI